MIDFVFLCKNKEEGENYGKLHQIRLGDEGRRNTGIGHFAYYRFGEDSIRQL